MNDIAEISELVARERLYRVRHNPAISDCYYPDATVATSWQSGSIYNFLNQEPAEVDPRFSINESDNLYPVVPGTHLDVDPKELEKFRPSYQFLAYVRLAAGGSISQELLGIDRPDDIKKLYQQAEQWLLEKNL